MLLFSNTRFLRSQSATKPVSLFAGHTFLLTAAHRHRANRPLHNIIIVADGRQDGCSVGMYGAHTALNVTGGGLSEMWFQDDILNQPDHGEMNAALCQMMFFHSLRHAGWNVHESASAIAR